MPVHARTRWGVVIFPGSNCDHDAIEALSRHAGQEVVPVWHRERLPDGLDGVVLPGGFSYGDYLRSGAIARFAPVMEDVVRFADGGGLVIGVCNGFQILTEAGLLPGALGRNAGLRFICREVYLRVERTDTPFTSRYTLGQVLKIPIAHNEGNFYLPEDNLDRIESTRRVVFRYCDREGRTGPEFNPNGASRGIAGIINETGNVLGMMPHPERRCDPLLGSPDGLGLFQSAVDFLARN
ncbi:MAG: phosphoribosylformylglycinamidine synthase subunit PurQ [Calditrichaeota bacterium]|nr:phosphoribosylformylglycinamidine synthase subunit PurQ [Calditrichota bacterium]